MAAGLFSEDLFALSGGHSGNQCSALFSFSTQGAGKQPKI